MSPAANMIAHIGSSDRQARVRRASAFQRVLCRSPRSWASMSGGLGDGDGEAERFELADVAAGSAVLVGAVVVVLARAEVLVVGGWVGERFHMITRMVRATATRALRLPRRLTMRRQRSARRVAVRALRQRLPPGRLSGRGALAGECGAAAGPALDDARGELGPGRQVPGGREPVHVQADLGDDGLGASRPMPVIWSRRSTAGSTAA
jgi:hypothetical protein